MSSAGTAPLPFYPSKLLQKALTPDGRDSLAYLARGKDIVRLFVIEAGALEWFATNLFQVHPCMQPIAGNAACQECG